MPPYSFGHQIHSVSQRGHHHHVGRDVHRGQFLATYGLMQIMHRRYADPSEFAINPTNLVPPDPKCL
jgi:hypothetical protein